MKLKYSVASEKDLPFIMEVYNQNIEALHGNDRNSEVWRKLLSDINSAYYIVCSENPVAWFRVDYNEDDSLELGMLQVKPIYHHQGIGKFVLSIVENLAKEKGLKKVVIHTTEDNHIAQMLYSSSGYLLMEIGPCTTADGQTRVGYTYQKVLT